MTSNGRARRDWPIMPRPGVTDPLVTALSARPARSQLLRGGSGFGKTVIAAQVAERLGRRNKRVIPVVALEELSGIPLAALAPLISSREIAARASETSERVQELVGLVGAAPESYVLVVDDVPLLDSVSASIVYQLIRVYGVAALLTARDEHELTGPIARLLHEDLVTLTELDPLSENDTAMLFERYLGSPLRPDSARTVFRTTEGNPLFVREVAFAAERTGSVRHTERGLTQSESEMPEHVLAPLRSRIARLSAEDVHLARLLAISQPWPIHAAEQRYAESLISLRDKGIVTVGPDKRVRLGHPLLTEVIRASVVSGHEQLAIEATTVLGGTGEEVDRFNAICLVLTHTSLRSGLGSPESFEWAAGQAIAGGDPATALRLAQAASKHGSRFLSQLHIASSLSVLGEEDRASSAFEDALETATNDSERALVALRWGQHTAYRQNNPATAVQRSEALMSSLGSDSSVALSVEVVKWRLMAGLEGGQIDALAAASHEDALSCLATNVNLAMLGAMSGDSQATRTAIAEARPFVPACMVELPFATELLALSEVLAEIADCRIGGARSIAEQRRYSGIPDASGQWSYVLAIVELHNGNPEQARRLAELAAQQLAWRDFTGLAVAATALSALASALSGDEYNARAILSGIEASALSDIKVRLHVAEAEAWLAYRAGNSALAGTLLQEAVLAAVRQGHGLLAALAASHALPMSVSAALREALAEAENDSPSRFTALVNQALRANLDAQFHDSDEFIADLRGAGLGAVADSLIQRSKPAQGFASLSPREQQITRAVADHARSREIAHLLGVSVRTVDNHLARIYRKLGVSGRDELRKTLSEQH